MPTSYGALCTDFYVNMKLAVKMDMPSERETVLHFFDRMRKLNPGMDRFRRYQGELALESSRNEPEYSWLAMRRGGLRAGRVNPSSMDASRSYHTGLLEQAPYHLTLSPLDLDYLEVLYGFDLECERDHDEVVFEALYADSPLAELMRPGGAAQQGRPLDVQPVAGISLSRSGDMQAFFEVKTRPRSRRGRPSRNGEPISLLVTVRRYGPIGELDELPRWFAGADEACDALASERLVPHLLTPISRLITSSA